MPDWSNYLTAGERDQLDQIEQQRKALRSYSSNPARFIRLLNPARFIRLLKDMGLEAWSFSLEA